VKANFEPWGHNGVVGTKMRITKTFATTLAALAMMSASALAADIVTKAPKLAAAPEPSPWDFAAGGSLASDYIFRGITQSAHKPSASAYFEPRYNVTKDIQLYIGAAGESIDFPNHAAAEVDFYGGIRPTFGAVTFDFGFWYYYYPGGMTFNGLGPATSCTNLFFTPTGGCNTLKGNVSFWETYGKVTWNVNDNLALGGNVYYSPSWLNSHAYGTYASGTAKYTFPALPSGLAFYVSGEGGYYWFGTTDAFYGTPAFPFGIKYPNYATWNLGVGATYKVLSADLRYYDTNLSKANCNVLTGDHTAGFAVGNISATNPSGLGSNWCSAAIVGKVAVDITLNSNIK
jgi:uncharacterized protein (TIGR02001 family)